MSDIKEEFDKIFSNKINEGFCYIPKEEFIQYFKNITSKLQGKDFCYSYESNMNDEDNIQYSGTLSTINIENNSFAFLGEFEETCGENEKQEILLPIGKINRDIKIVFNYNPWMGAYFNDLPQTTDIFFYEVVIQGNYKYYRIHQIVFYFNLKDTLFDLIRNKNMTNKVIFNTENEALTFFNNIKDELIGKNMSYWNGGEDLLLPILNIEIRKEERYEKLTNLIKITTESNTEEIYCECLKNIQLSDNYLYFDQRAWDGSEYKIKL